MIARNSIRFRLIILLLLATIIPIVASMFISYHYTVKSVRNDFIRNNSNLIYQGKINVLNYMNTLEQSSLSVYRDADFLRYIEQTTHDDYLGEGALYRGLTSITFTSRSIYQVYLQLPQRGSSFLAIQGLLKRRYDGQTPEYLPRLGRNEVALLEPPHTSHDYGLAGLPYYKPETVFTLHRQLFLVPSSKPIGLLSIDVRMDELVKLSEQLYAKDKENAYIIDRSGTVIYSPQEQEIGKRLKGSWTAHLLQADKPSGYFEMDKRIHLYETLQTSYMDWLLIKQIPYDSLYADARELTRIHVIIAVVSLLIVIAATLLISVRITQPIRQLIGYINQIQTGRLDIDIEVPSNDEIGILSRRFRIMMQTINQLIVQEYKLDLANKTNQIKALQAQINPHFMNNALQSIGTLALQHNAPHLYSLIASLGKMMRYSMNTNETSVPFVKEINHVESYLLLQKQRFDDLTVRFETDQAAYPRTVPKMIIQPIVENCFKHGFESYTGNKEICIRAGIQGHILSIEVEDNGIGMPPEPLAALQEKLQAPEMGQSQTGEDNIGLCNVAARLKMVCGEDAQLRLESCEPQGLRVGLYIPLEKEVHPE